MIMKTQLAILALACLALTGCTGLGTARVISALGKDTNSVRVVVTSIYGNITVERNLPYRMVVAP